MRVNLVRVYNTLVYAAEPFDSSFLEKETVALNRKTQNTGAIIN